MDCLATLQLAELHGVQGRTAEARELFAKAGAARSVDLKEFPAYFGTNPRRGANQKRVAFSAERNLGEPAFGSAISAPPGRAQSCVSAIAPKLRTGLARSPP